MRTITAMMLAIAFTLIILSTTNDSHHRLAAYTQTAFTGNSTHLTATHGACYALNHAVKSARNNSTSLHLALFADVTCTTPVSVVSATQHDAGIHSSRSLHTFSPGTQQLNLLGQRGARSYRTIPVAAPISSISKPR